MAEPSLPEVMPPRAERLDVVEFDSDDGMELVVLDLRARRAHLLSGVTAVVFDACDGATTATELLQDFIKVLDISEPDIRVTVVTTLDELRASYLLDGPEPPEPDLTLHRIHRRRRPWQRRHGPSAPSEPPP